MNDEQRGFVNCFGHPSTEKEYESPPQKGIPVHPQHRLWEELEHE